MYSSLKNEKKTGELLPLPKDFYKRHEIGSLNTEELQNTAKALNMLKEKRTQKILVYVAYGKTIPQPLPIEEEELYNKIRQILKKEKKDKISIKIKINSNIPEILTPNNSKLGPFKQNEVVEFQEQSDVKFIVENKIGEIIEE